jgi:hypothetical protein
MKNHKSKKEILDDLSKKEFFDEKGLALSFFEFWYDGDFDYYEGMYSPDDEYFVNWLNDPQRLRDEKLDQLLGITKNNTIKDFLPKNFKN